MSSTQEAPRRFSFAIEDLPINTDTRAVILAAEATHTLPQPDLPVGTPTLQERFRRSDGPQITFHKADLPTRPEDRAEMLASAHTPPAPDIIGFGQTPHRQPTTLY